MDCFIKNNVFKHLQTDNNIIIRFLDDNGHWVFPNPGRYVAKLANENGYFGDYPVEVIDNSFVLSSGDLTDCGPGDYKGEIWGTWLDKYGKTETSIYPSPGTFFNFSITSNILDGLTSKLKEVNVNDIISSAVKDVTNQLGLPSLGIFDKVTIIGDSYSAGWLLKPDGSNFYDKSKFQWPRLIGKKYGFTVNNLSMSGWTAQDFVNNKLSDIANSTPQDAYIIALGINDQSNGKEVLGTKNDLKPNYQSNPDTFYGNMGKIIGTIKENDSNARIILLTIMRNDGAVTAQFNNAIKLISSFYNIPVANIDNDPYFDSKEYTNRKEGGHPTIVGYAVLASHLEIVLQKTILDNYDYFCNTTSIFDNTVK